MSPTFKLLTGWLLVVLAASVLLDWQDSLKPLQQEASNSVRLQQRLQAPSASTDWTALEKTARQAHAAWLDQLVEAPTTGVFRAIAMERLADLCQSLSVPCQVGAMGEKMLEPGTTSTSTSTATNTASPARRSATSPAESDLKGLMSATVRISFPLSNPHLHDLLAAIETGPPLRSVDRLTVRAGQVEMLIQTYGILSAEAPRVRSIGAPSAPAAEQKP